MHFYGTNTFFIKLVEIYIILVHLLPAQLASHITIQTAPKT